MKKKILISSISIIFVCFISFLSTHSVNAAGGEEKYVAAKSGINLRSGPSKSSKVITTIPFGSKVTIKKSEGNEIFLDERYGKWVNVKFGNKTGWVFSGFLCDFKPDTIIKPVADFYRDKYRKDEYYSKYKEYTHFKDSEVSIGTILDNYIVLGIPNTSSGTGDVVWRYDVKEKKFFEAFDIRDWYTTIYLFYLNDDKYPDLFVDHGCCSGTDIDILFGSEKGFITVDKESTACYGYSYLIEGSCKDMKFACDTYEGDFDGPENYPMMYFYNFNCEKKKFEYYAKSEIIRSEGIIKSIDWVNMSIVINDTSYKISDRYKFYNRTYSEKNIKSSKEELQKGKEISFDYVLIDGKKIFLGTRGN